MRNYSGKRSKAWLVSELYWSSSYSEERSKDPKALKEKLMAISYRDLLAKYKWLFGEDR